MPRGVPRLGQFVEETLREDLGVLKEQPSPLAFGVEGDVTELPPPWEADPNYAKDNTDARRFVTVPGEWELRWINPRLLEAAGWRDWMPVMGSDPRVKVLVRSLIDVGGNIRRGGPDGDILAWMPKHWVESRLRLKAERVARLTRQAVDRQDETAEAVRKASKGMVVVESASHPTHTAGEGRTMTDQ